jgi:aspartate/methionine/tyrosine aminotransferase
LKPKAGTTALVFYDKDILSEEFAKKLMDEKETLVVPGSCFEIEHCMRIGYVYDSQQLQVGLDMLAAVLREW